jgi:hypothetical protein
MCERKAGTLKMLLEEGMKSMPETMGSVVKKTVLAAERLGLRITDEKAREAIARENDDYIADAFNPLTPVPDIPKETVERYAESLLAK